MARFVEQGFEFGGLSFLFKTVVSNVLKGKIRLLALLQKGEPMFRRVWTLKIDPMYNIYSKILLGICR